MIVVSFCCNVESVPPQSNPVYLGASVNRHVLRALCLACVLGIAYILQVPSQVSAKLAYAATDPIKQAPFPADFAGALPLDVDTAAVGPALAPLRALQKAGKTEQATMNLMVAQRQFDITAWKAFLALNWPVTDDADPKPGTPITSPDGQPRWSFWRPSQSIFLPNGERPTPWDAAAAAAQEKSGELVLKKTKAAWRQHASPQDNFEAFSGPLVDQNGKWVRFEALVNHEEFDYIRTNELYSLDGQVAFTQRDSGNEVDFPANTGDKHGAIEIKLAWKEISPGEDASRMYTTRVKVRIAGPAASDGKPRMRTITAGLVGMHIAMRTASSPQWIWATFEQIDNTRQNPMAHGMSHPSFMNAALANAPVNVLPPMNALPKTPGGTDYTSWFEDLTTTPVQVKRIALPTQPGLNDFDAAISLEVAALNKQVQAMLQKQGSVFQYYELIGTQWPVHPNAPAFVGGNDSAPDSLMHKTPGDVVPSFLVNTTMETYFQKGVQPAGPQEQDDRLPAGSVLDPTVVNATESCVGCHYSAGIAVGFKKNPDGTFMRVNGARIPIFGEYGGQRATAHAHFSWMLQLEAQAPNDAPRETIPTRQLSGIKQNVMP